MPLGRLLAACIAVTGVVGASPPVAQDSPGTVDVLEVTGPLDGRMIDWVTDELTRSTAQLVVIELDSAGALTSEVEALAALIAEPPVPVAVWVGPAPAVAFGGAGQLVAAAPISAAAPDSVIGQLAPTVAGGPRDAAAVAARFPSARAATNARLIVGRSEMPFVDHIQPSIGQLIIGLDGLEMEIDGLPATLATARVVTREDGTTTMEPLVEVRFRRPDLLTRTLRLAIRPEAAFFFLVAGIALGTFEFYAAGAGLVAAVGVAGLILAGYGLSVLPIRWWALAAILIGLAAYAADFQRRAAGVRSIAGTALLVVGGLFLVDAAPQFSVRWWAVALIVAGAALFYGIGMTAVVRARFSTQTIGRDYLIGRTGRALTRLAPAGDVVLDGATWKATAGRAAGIDEGDEVRVTGIQGVELRVEPAKKNSGPGT